ncbi:MAG: hypothetical protein ISP90_10455 [Nevskia sp.]|nr:hypothetical protein [Nevskia sp.]
MLLSLAALCAGCATAPQRVPDALAETEFLGRAMEQSPAAREATWRATLAGRPGIETSLRVALLQSVPEHSGYDPAAAQRGLRALLAQNPPEDVAAVARVRLGELRLRSQCENESLELRRRLSKVAQIERDLDPKLDPRPDPGRR